MLILSSFEMFWKDAQWLLNADGIPRLINVSVKSASVSIQKRGIIYHVKKLVSQIAKCRVKNGRWQALYYSTHTFFEAFIILHFWQNADCTAGSILERHLQNCSIPQFARNAIEKSALVLHVHNWAFNIFSAVEHARKTTGLKPFQLVRLEINRGN